MSSPENALYREITLRAMGSTLLVTGGLALTIYRIIGMPKPVRLLTLDPAVSPRYLNPQLFIHSADKILGTPPVWVYLTATIIGIVLLLYLFANDSITYPVAASQEQE